MAPRCLAVYAAAMTDEDDDTPATPDELVAETRAADLLPRVFRLDGARSIIVEDREGVHRVELAPQGLGWARRTPHQGAKGREVMSRARRLLLLIETGWEPKHATLH
ncbi:MULTISPECIES: hypothetical protein [unclassified Corallococcus]|uniref:hypothetical protein n=1 Tax=unclassified Corallococcus TaxID=2685029 RepID=UPI001A8DF4F3|nr:MULTISPECIES: hypothetical protein [unclassified Corallococcus]MBN9685400.1 hypothetical protein [Corallococcus sp. NCSPR001]WAS83149.1 hypothetical protein O0N60_27990 [Corallococcus sp. NCRR]